MGNILSSSSSSSTKGKPKVSFVCKMDYNVMQMHMNRFTVYVPWTYHYFPRLYNWHAQCTYNVRLFCCPCTTYQANPKASASWSSKASQA